MLSGRVNRQTLGALKKSLGHAYHMESWPDRLKRLRNATKPRLSQAKVAHAFGIAPSSVAQWELGRGKPSIDKLPRLAQLYGTTLRELCGDDLPFVDPNDSGAGLQSSDEVTKEAEEMFVLLRRAWMLLSRDERRGVLAAIDGLLLSRSKSA